MRKITRRSAMQSLLAAPAVLLGTKGGLASAGGDGVDLALVLAIDASGSVDDGRWSLQQRGYAEAFRSKEIVDVITSGAWGKIAVTLVVWGSTQKQRIGWTIIDDEETSFIFAQKMEEVGRPMLERTGVSGAIKYSAALLRFLRGIERRAIDISGDGVENVTNTGTVELERNIAVSQKITINGLPILGGAPLRTSEPVDRFYERAVIGGPGCFMIVATGWEDLARAIKRKLMLEIAGLTPTSQHA